MKSLIAIVLVVVALPATGEQVLRRSSTGEPQTLDPQMWVYGQDGNIAQDLFHGLTTLDARARVVPGSAASWTVSADGRVYRYRLRDGLEWSDGKRLDSADFLYSFRRLFDPATAAPAAGLLFVIVNAAAVNRGELPVERLGVTAPDSHTIEIRLTHPAPYFNELIVHRALPVPRHVIERFGRNWTRPEHIVSNGAFVLSEWRPNSYVKLHRNPRFYAAKQVALDVVYHIPVEDPATALRRFRAGELDAIVSVPSEQLGTLRRSFGAQLRLVQQLGLEYYAFNTRRKPFDDARIRQALSISVDRELLAGKVLGAGEPPSTCVVPPSVHGYFDKGCEPGAALPMAERRARARDLLREAGFGPQRRLALRLRYNNADTQRKVALAVASMWKPLGVDVELLAADMKAHQQYLASGDFDVARAAWYAEDSDAVSFLRLLDSRATGINVSRFRSTRYDALLDRAESIVDAGERARTLRQAELLAIGAHPLMPLYGYVGRRLVSDRIRGWIDNPRGVHLSRYMSVVEVSPR
ncbi:MAG: peptide ABC transporter substrate-binding protein [Steroidobacteraceae bacterium]